MTAPDRGAHTKSPLPRRGRPHMTLGHAQGWARRFPRSEISWTDAGINSRRTTTNYRVFASSEQGREVVIAERAQKREPTLKQIKGGRLMRAILNRATAIPTVRHFGYSVYLTATVLCWATTVYAQRCRPPTDGDGLTQIKPNKVGSATRLISPPPTQTVSQIAQTQWQENDRCGPIEVIRSS